jgi:hypothetical protein
MILDDSIFIFYDIFMVETLEYVDLLFDGPDVFLADGHFLHGDKNAIIEIDALVYFSVGPLADFLDKLVAFYHFVSN